MLRATKFIAGVTGAFFLVVGSGCSRDLELPTPPKAGGLVGALDTKGHLPLEGNEVKLVRTDAPGRVLTTTDADGGFGVTDLGPGMYQLQVDLPGFAPLREGPFAQVPGQLVDVGTFAPLWLAQTASEGLLSGLVIVKGSTTVTDAGSFASQAQGATVTFLLERQSGTPVKVNEVTVNASGAFSARLPPGRYTLVATHPLYLSDTKSGVELKDGEQKDLSQEPLALDINPSTVTGQVVLEVDHSTDAGVGDQVTVRSDTGLSVTTNATGGFTLGGLAAGARTLTFERTGYHDGLAARTVTLGAAETRDLGVIKLLLDRGDLTGAVEMADGSPLQQVAVDVPGAVGYSSQATASTGTPSQGRFVLAGLPVGSYNVRASRPSYVAAQSATVTVKANVPTDVGTLRLARIQGDFLIDDADPTNTPGYTRKRDVTLQLSNVVNAAQYRVAGSPTELATASYQPYSTNTIAYTLSAGDEVKTVYLQIKDTQSNEGAPLLATITLDTTPPTGTGLTLAGGQGFTRIANPLPVTLNAVDDTSGVAWVKLSAVNDADAGVELSATRVPFVRDTSFTRPQSSDGPQTVFAQFVDNAGNASDVVFATIVIDTVAPTGTVTISRGDKASLEGFTNSLLVDLLETPGAAEPNGGSLFLKLANDVTELATAVQNPTRAHAAWFLDAQGEGTKTLSYQFVDSAGNASAVGQATIVYDATPPQVSAALVSPLPTNDAGVLLQLTTLETNPFSPDGGVAVSESALFTNAQVSTYPSTGLVSFTLSPQDGVKTVYVRVRDAAGNDGTASVGAELDTTPPSGIGLSLTGALADGTPSTTLTATSTVTVNLSHAGASRVLLGDDTMIACPGLGTTWRTITGTAVANHPLPGSGATRTVTACYADGAGNVAGPVTATIAWDGAGPTGCALQLQGLRANGTASGIAKTALRQVPFTLTGCSETPLEIAITEQAVTACAPNTPGLTWEPYDAVVNELILSSIDGAKTAKGCVRDAARNTQAFTAATITLDTTPPSNPRVVLNGGAAYVNGLAVDGGVAVVSALGTAVGAFEWAVEEEGTTPSTFVDVLTQNPRTLPLSAGDGVKTVRAIFRDDVGNTTGEVGDSIEVDTTPPTLTGLTLVGTLADGTQSTSVTAITDVTANLTQTGATTVFTGDATVTACPGAGHQPLTGSSTRVTLSGSGTSRTVKACVGDAAGNLSPLLTATIDLDTAGPSGCALVLTGLRADDALPTTGGAANKTGRRDVGYALTSCTETPVEIVLTESTASCGASASLTWTAFNPAAANSFTVSALDGAKTVRGCVRDAARNTQAITAASITLDTTPPSGGNVEIDTGAPYVNASQKAARGGINQVTVQATVSGATEWALAENATPSAFTALASSNPASFTFSPGDGVKTVRALFRDDVGNTTAALATDSIEFDTVAPSLTSIALSGPLADGTLSEDRTTSTTVWVSVIQSGGTGLALSPTALTTCAGASFASYSGGSVQTTLGATGNPRGLWACLSDAAGNTAGPVQDTITVDTAGPSGCTLVMSGKRADGTATALDKSALRDVDFTFSGCSEAPFEVFLTEASTVSCTSAATLAWRPFDGVSGSTTLSAVDGLKTVRGCVRDAARTVSSFVLDTITLDTTPPTGAQVSIKGGAAFFNAADFVANTPDSNAMSVTGTATGAAEWAIAEGALPTAFSAFTSPATTTFTFSAGDGPKTIRALFKDDLGNVTPVEVTDGIEVDTAAPTLASVTLTGTLADGTPSNTNSTTATVTVSFSNAGATQAVLVDGAVTTCPSTGWVPLAGVMSMTLPGSGAVRTVKGCVADAAGNAVGPLAAATMTIDAVTPSGCALVLVGKKVDGTATSGPTADKTAQADVTVTLSGCTETAAEIFLTEASSVSCTATAPLDWRPASGAVFTLSSVDGPKTVRGCVRDATHNVDSVVADAITLDTTAPTGASVVIKGDAPSFNLADWLANTPDSNAMAVTGTATGATEWAVAEGAAPASFVAFSSPSSTTFTFSAGDGTKSIRALFRDDVGNTSAEVSDGIDVDTAAPTLTSLTLIGTLGDGSSSTALTTTTAVTGSLVHSGGTQVFFGDATLSVCPTSGYAALSGNLANTTLTGSGTTRTVKACIADAAGNTAGPVSDTIDLNFTPPGGCALTLVGRRVDGAATSGATADKTALRDVTYSLSCVEATEIFLTEEATVTCNDTTPHPWVPVVAGTVFTLSDVDGPKTVRGCVRNPSLTVSALVADAITLDTTPPQGAAVVVKSGATWFNRADWLANTPDSNAMPVTGSAVGAAEWAVAEGAVPASFVAFTSPSTTTTFTFSAGDGTKTIRALFRDDVGNTTPVEVTDAIDVDTALPTLTSVTLTGTLADGLPSTTNTSTAQVSAALVHVGGTQVVFGDATMTSCPATGYAPLTGASMPVTLGGAGTTRTVTACIADAAGNPAGVVSDTIDLDTSTPGGCALTLVGKRVDGNPTTGPAADRTARQDVTATLSGCTETPLEISVTEATTVSCTATASLTWQPLSATGTAAITLSSGDALKTVRGCVRDVSRNVASFVADGITLDTTPPSAASVVLKGGAAYFNNADFVANTPDSNTIGVTGTAFGATEWAIAENVTPTTFVAFTSPQTTPLLFSAGDGTKTVKARFRDEVGNELPVEVSDTIVVDTAVPTISSVLLTGTLADNTSSTVSSSTSTVTASVTQSGGTLIAFGDSTMTTCPATGYTAFDGLSAQLTLPGTGPTRTVTVCVSDAAGNTAGPVSDAIDYDNAAPTGCQLALVGKKVDGTATSGATVDKTALRDVGITLTGCSDASTTEVYVTESLSVTCTAVNAYAWVPLNAATALTLTAGDGTKTVRGCLRDAARNTSSFTTDTIALDTAPPNNASVTIKGGAAYFNSADFLANTPDSNAMSVSGSAMGAVDWAIAEDATPSTFTALAATNPSTFTFSAGDGTKTIRALFRDDVGNVTPSEVTDTIEVDTAGPTLTSINLTGTLADGLPNDTWTNTTNVTLSFVQSGAAGFLVGDSSLAACPSAGYASFSGTSALITLPGSGTVRTVRVCVSDLAGNTAGYLSDSINFDASPPGGCALTLVGHRADTNAVTSGGTAEKSGRNKVDVSLGSCLETPTEVALTEAEVTCANVNSMAWQPWTAGSTTFTLSAGDTSKLVRGCVRDAARNVGSLTSDTITLDTTPPEWTYVYLHMGATYFNAADFAATTPANSNSIRVTGYAYASSGVAATEWALAEGAAPTSFVSFVDGQTSYFPFSAGDGTKTIRVLFRDDVGNVTPAETTDSIEVDTAVPTLTDVVLWGSLGDGTQSTSVTASSYVESRFTQSGATLVAFGGAGYTCPTYYWQYQTFNGTNAYAYGSVSGGTLTSVSCLSDAAGNVVGPTTRTIPFDSAAPTGCALTLNGRKVDGTTTSGAQVDRTAQPTVGVTLSGCAEAPVDIFLTESTVTCSSAAVLAWGPWTAGATNFTLSSGDGSKTVRGCVRDAARNVASLTLDTITLDTTPPTGATVSLKSGASYFNRADWLAAGSANTIAVTGTAVGATEWSFSETAPGASWAAFSSPTTSALTFGAGDGPKSVRALFRDDLGNTTASEVSDGIEVDTAAPTLSSLTLVGTLGDGTTSTAITSTATVTANLVQSGGTLLASGDATFTCPTSVASFSAFNGSSAQLTLGGAGTPRTLKACVSDAAGNTSSVATDTIEFDNAVPTGCALLLTGKKVDGTATSGALVDQTAVRDVTLSLSGCSDTTVQLALTEAASVTCSNAVALTWFPLVPGTSTFQLTTGDAAKTVRGCIRDAALNVGTLAADSITLDTTPPESPTVALSGTNGYSQAYAMNATGSADGAFDWMIATSAVGPWNAFQTYGAGPTATLVASFSSPDGTKTVYAKFRDALQNATPAVTASVVVDTTLPTTPPLLTVDGQNRSARLFWDPSTDTNGIARYELWCGAASASALCATTAGTATDGWVLNLSDKTDQYFAVRSVDNAGNSSAFSATLKATIGFRRTSVTPGSVYPIRPLDVAVNGPDVFVTYMDTDFNWAGIGGTLKVAVSHDRGQTWAYKTLDSSFGGNRSQAPIAFNDSAVWVASVANGGFTGDVVAGQVRIWSSTNRGDTFTDVSNASLANSANYGKTDGLGLMTSGDGMRLMYMLASSTSAKHLNEVYSTSGAASTNLQTTYDVSSVFGYAPYQVTGNLKSCSGNFSSLTLWRDRNSSTGIETNLRAITHYYLPDTTFDSAAGEGLLEAVTFGSGAGQEVGAFDVACVSLPETMQAYLVYNRAPAAAWAVGSGGSILKWDDSSWTTTQSPTTRTIYSVQDVWAVGQAYTASGSNYDTILRYNGTSWEELPLTSLTGGWNLVDIWSSSPSNVYAVGNGGVIIKWDGSTWASVTSPTTTALTGIWGSSATNVFAVGYSGTILRYTGTSWATMTSPTTNTLYAIWGNSSVNAWAVGAFGTILKWNGTSWATFASPTTASLTSVWGSSSSDVWAVGNSGTIIHFNGTSWSTFTSPTTYSLNEVAGVSATEVWAVGAFGTAIKYNGSSWSVVPTATTNTLYSVWGGTSGGGSASNVYSKRKLSSLSSFGSAMTLRTDGDPTQPPLIWAGGRNVYVLYRDTSNRLMLGQSTNEGQSYSSWTSVESGANKGLYAVLSGENSSDVAVAFTDQNGAALTVLLPALPSFPLTAVSGVSTTGLSWPPVNGVDRYQITYTPGNPDYTSVTQASIAAPASGVAPAVEVLGVDARGMPGNSGESWQLRPFTDSLLVSNFSTAPWQSATGGVVAYDAKVAVWPPKSSISSSELTLYRSSDYGQTWSTYLPAAVGTTGARAFAGFGGKMVMFYEDSAATNILKAYTFTDLVGTGTAATIQSTIPIDEISAKATTTGDGIVVAYSDVTSDLIRVAVLNSALTVTLRTTISTTAANTIGTIEVAKADSIYGRVVVSWREYSTGDPRTDSIKAVESLNGGVSWGSVFTLASGTSSPNNGSIFTDYNIGNSYLAGSNNGAFSVMSWVTEYNDFWHRNSNLKLMVTGTDHSTAVSSSTYATFTLDSETVDSAALDAFANADGHYLAYHSQSLDGTLAKLKLAYCVADCHLASRWTKSLLKSWTTNVKDQAGVVDVTVGQTSSTLYDPAVYVLYQEASSASGRNLKVMAHGVHRRTK